MNRANIPQTDSIHELADFWDTHDLTDFENELEIIKTLAKSRGISPANLIREWVLEHIEVK